MHRYAGHRSWSCVLGDDDRAYHFMHTLHRLYLCLPPLYLYQIPPACFGKVRPPSSPPPSQNTHMYGKVKRTRQIIEILPSQIDISESQPRSRSLEDAVRAYLMKTIDNYLQSGVHVHIRPEKIQIRNLQHLLFPDLTFGLDSPSLPPKRSRFFYIKMEDDLDDADEAVIWPANPPFPIGRVRLVVSVGMHQLSNRTILVAKL